MLKKQLNKPKHNKITIKNKHISLDTGRTMIEIRQLTKTFHHKGQSFTALNNINLHIPKGRIVGVIGGSGAGKSTLIRCVNLLERPTSGQIFLNGQELTALSNSDLIRVRQKMGMIFQHFNLLSSRTVFENIALPLELAKHSKLAIKEKVTELLNLVGLSDKHDSYPANLSGGQKQRVAIARALASDPDVLLCDEATSALDPATTQSILALLKTINQKLNLTILLITHEMDVVKHLCHDIAIIHDGELIEQGDVGTLFSQPKTKLAQKFIRSTLNLSIPEDYQARLSQTPTPNSYPLVRLEFTGESVDAPLISQVTRQFNLDISILNADMNYVGGVKFGLMLAEFFGNEDATNDALNYLKDHKVNVEVLGYVA